MEYIIGIDEVGRGSSIGELTVCGIRADINWKLEGLADSKQLSKTKRNELNKQLLQEVKEGIITYAIVSKSNEEIDEIGLGICLKQSYVEVIQALYQPNDQVILDGNLSPKYLLEYGLRDISGIKSEIKADTKIPTVMAASIIAKVYRDSLVENEYHPKYPHYEWNKNMGYLSTGHRETIKEFGLSPLHRRSFKII